MKTKSAAATPRKPAPAIPGIGTPGNGAPGGVLPGLAAFGKMHGVAGAAPAPRPAIVPAAPAAPVEDDLDSGYAEDAAYDLSDEAAGYETPEEDYLAAAVEQEEASYGEEANYEEAEPEFSFSDQDLEALIREGAEAETPAAVSDGADESGSEEDVDAGHEFDDYEDADTQAFVFEDEPRRDADETAGLDDGYDEDFGKASGRALKTFEAGYEGPPEIRLDAYGPEADEDGPQSFFNDGAEGDAAFLDQEFDASAMPPVREGRGRKYMMVASALVGALALGGAFAFAYKIGGGSSGDTQPPLIQADARPAKVAPAEPGGKEFPHKNKLIYERLNGASEPANEQLVPRQEQVAAAPALRPGDGQKEAALPQGSGDTPQVTASAAPAEAPEAPRKVRTLLVRPDGTLVQPPAAEQPPAVAAAPPPPPEPQTVPAVSQTSALQRPKSGEPVRPVVLGAAQPAPAATAEPAPATAAPPPVPVSEPPAAQVPPPISKPSPPPVAVASAPAAPAPQASASNGAYVVQVAARKSQADALAAFADLQQKYPDLLSGYRPMIQRADLGDRGVWYRLRVGPMNEKTAAADLCSKLKSAGIGSCLVREE